MFGDRGVPVVGASARMHRDALAFAENLHRAGGKARLDLVVRRPRGDEVWRWSHDKAFTQVIQTLLLRPQESSVLRVAWDQRDLQGRRVDPGNYEAIVVFMGRVEGAGRTPATLAPLAFTIGSR